MKDRTAGRYSRIAVLSNFDFVLNSRFNVVRVMASVSDILGAV
jgi:hypothetical protein